MSLKLTILGFHSALPKENAHPTAQLLEIAGKLFLIDCGEGTQVQMRKAGAKFSRLDHIFISHLHGDHVFGLAGLLSSFNLLGRKKAIHIYGPTGIKEFIEVQMRLAGIWDGFPIIFQELNTKESTSVFENDKLEVITIPLKHRLPTNGYLFREKTKLRRINKEAIEKVKDLDSSAFRKLQLGIDFENDSGEVFSNNSLTHAPPPSYSYAFCSDTQYKPDIIPLIKNVDLLYHESTFSEEHSQLAKKTGHSTAKQAASIAKQAEVGQLILGHFSSRYRDFTKLQEEAKEVFPSTALAGNLKEFVLG